MGNFSCLAVKLLSSIVRLCKIYGSHGKVQMALHPGLTLLLNQLFTF